MAKPIGVPDRARPILSGKFGAALTAASSQDGAAGTGTHTQTEAVNLCTTAVVWLERSLAHKSISMTVMSRAISARRKTVGCTKGINRLNLKVRSVCVKPEDTQTKDYECQGEKHFATTHSFSKTGVALIHRFSIRSRELSPAFHP